MNNSNESLRFSRSYTEATGQRIRPTDFASPEPIVTGLEALFWVSVVGVVSVIVFIFRGL